MEKLSLEILRSYSSPNSYSKGIEYYEDGRVKKVLKSGNTFQAVVQGTANYQVKIQKEDEWEFYCTCPYDWGGICKHCVATGLAIIHQEYEEKEPDKKQKSSLPVKQFLEEIYEKSSTLEKETFLRKLLTQDVDLRQQFISFISGTEKIKLTEDISKIRDHVHQEFVNLDFSELDYDLGYDDYNYYHDEWEIYYDNALEVVQNIFDYYFSKITQYMHQGNLIDAFAMVLGLYEGIYNVHFSEKDEYEIMGDSYNDLLFENYNELIERFLEQDEKIVINEEIYSKAIDLLFDRIAYYLKKKKLSKDEQEIEYQIQIFEKIFLYWIKDKTQAQKAMDYFKKLNLWDSPIGKIKMHIAELLEDKDLWFKAAEKHLLEDEKIAFQLIQEYRKDKNRDAELRVLQQAFYQWPDEFDHYIVEHYDFDSNPDLYKKAYAHYCYRNLDVNTYKVMRQFLTEKEKNEFIASCQTEIIFYAQLLAVENRYQEILDLVKKQKDLFYFTQLILPILNIYPDECYHMIRHKVDTTLINGRGRQLYQQIVELLKKLRMIKQKETEIRAYLKELYGRKPILPALRDEMKKAGLV